MTILILALILLVSGSDGACADPISALVVGAIGLTGTAATIGTAIVDIGLAIGLSWAANKLSPKAKTGSTRGQSINLQIATNPSRKVPVGTVGNAGDLTYWQLSADDNERLHMVIALGDLECDSLSSTIFVDGKKKTIDGDGNVSGYGDKLVITFHNGDPDQTVDSFLSSTSDGRWTSNEVGKYICYAVVKCLYDEKLFPSGIPQIVFVLKGAKLYDWRKDGTNGGSGSHRWADPSTWEFSDNPIVALYSVLRGIAPGGVPLIGMGVPAAALRLSDFTAAANACDETVSLAAGGTEKRYRLSAVFDTSMTNRDIIETILQSCAGELIESCGIYRPMVGVAQTSVASITDADLIVTQPFQSDAKRPRTELYNAVYGSFSDPSRSYNEVPLPNRTSSEDEATDGGLRLPMTLDLACVTSRTQAQRIMEIARKRARRQLIVSCTLRARWFTLEPGDWITFNSDRRGYTDRVFEIQTIKVNADLTSDVVMREVDAGIDDWSTSDELADNQATDLASAGPGFSSVTGLVITTVVFKPDDESSVQTPSLAWQWDAVTDPTVISLDVEYRKVGDTVAIPDSIIDPTTGGVWNAFRGVQGEVTYEGRLRPVTAPARATDWTSWVTATSATDPQVVSSAAIALGVPDNTITPEMLSEQTRFELRLSTDKAEIQGSVSKQVQDAYDWALKAAETALRARLESYDIGARVTQEITQRVDGDEAIASLVQTAVTWIDENAATVSEVIESLNGVSARWGVAVQVVNGEHVVTGLVQLDGNAENTTFSILADKLVFADPNIPGSPPFQVVTVAEDPDTPGLFRMVLNGELIANSIRAGLVEIENLKALSSSFGDMTCSGIQRSANGKKVINWDTGQEWVDA